MTAFVALLRAVNVGGTGKLPMSELKAMCEALNPVKIAGIVLVMIGIVALKLA